MLSALLAAAIAMTRPADLRPDLAAFPRIARPTTAAERRINTAVARLDARARTAAARCFRDARPLGGDWERAVDTTMAGPRFVSFLVTDDVYCGGAHPSNGHAAIVYDLAPGAPVDWTGLLPASLTGTPELQEGADGVRTVTLSGPRLRALYAAGHDAALTAAEAPDECRGTVAEDGADVQPLQAWLDGRRGALAVQFDMSHAVQVCAVPVYLSAAILRREGASPRLVEALGRARR